MSRRGARVRRVVVSVVAAVLAAVVGPAGPAAADAVGTSGLGSSCLVWVGEQCVLAPSPVGEKWRLAVMRLDSVPALPAGLGPRVTAGFWAGLAEYARATTGPQPDPAARDKSLDVLAGSAAVLGSASPVVVEAVLVEVSAVGAAAVRPASGDGGALVRRAAQSIVAALVLLRHLPKQPALAAEIQALLDQVIKDLAAATAG